MLVCQPNLELVKLSGKTKGSAFTGKRGSEVVNVSPPTSSFLFPETFLDFLVEQKTDGILVKFIKDNFEYSLDDDDYVEIKGDIEQYA